MPLISAEMTKGLFHGLEICNSLGHTPDKISTASQDVGLRYPSLH